MLKETLKIPNIFLKLFEATSCTLIRSEQRQGKPNCTQKGMNLLLEVKNLSKHYGNKQALDSVSFSIEGKEAVGFLGINGAGKTTTMNILTGYISASDGDVLIEGVDILTDPFRAKTKIGYLPEQPPLYLEETPREYLRFVSQAKKIPRGSIKDEIEKVMEETQITEVADRLIKNLSKGYRQRVGIAQTLLGNPKVIILDEPTVGLDPIQVIEIRDLIKSLGQKHTVILSSHILSEVQHMCDEILIISKGKLIAYDTAENLEKMMAPKTSIEILTDASEEESRKVLEAVEGIEETEYIFQEDGTLQVLIYTTPQEEFAVRRVLSLKFAEIKKAILKLDIVKANLEDIFIELTNPEEDRSREDSGEEPEEPEDISENNIAEEEEKTEQTREEESL